MQIWRAIRRLTIVVPTLDEGDNVSELMADVLAATKGMDCEIRVIFVEDGDDGRTPHIIKEVANQLNHPDFQIELIHRAPEERWGQLGGAVMDGFRRANSEWVIVIDGDGQHPTNAIPAMWALAQTGHYDLIVGSRYVTGGDAGG
jgi:dolichol-phosphate mannosyltransferase